MKRVGGPVTLQLIFCGKAEARQMSQSCPAAGASDNRNESIVPQVICDQLCNMLNCYIIAMMTVSSVF